MVCEEILSGTEENRVAFFSVGRQDPLYVIKGKLGQTYSVRALRNISTIASNTGTAFST